MKHAYRKKVKTNTDGTVAGNNKKVHKLTSELLNDDNLNREELTTQSSKKGKNQKHGQASEDGINEEIKNILKNNKEIGDNSDQKIIIIIEEQDNSDDVTGKKNKKKKNLKGEVYDSFDMKLKKKTISNENDGIPLDVISKNNFEKINKKENPNPFDDVKDKNLEKKKVTNVGTFEIPDDVIGKKSTAKTDKKGNTNLSDNVKGKSQEKIKVSNEEIYAIPDYATGKMITKMTEKKDSKVDKLEIKDKIFPAVSEFTKTSVKNVAEKLKTTQGT